MSQIQEQDDLPLANYDRQNAGAIAAKLRAFSQRELRRIGAYEAAHAKRAVILSRIAALSGAEPWAGYDEQNAATISAALEPSLAARVLVYEREHKARTAVIEAASRALAG